jgi:hypothetical protein
LEFPIIEALRFVGGCGRIGGERGKGYQNGAKTEPDAGNPDVGKHMNSSVKTPLRRLRILPDLWVSSVLDPRLV